MSRPLLTVKLVGGLGNQLFAYATAKALALRNGCPLRLDAYSGYQRDAFGRGFELDAFALPDEILPPHHPFGHAYAERLVREANACLPARYRSYLFEKVAPDTHKHHYQPWLGEFQLRRQTYLNGNFTSPRYFETAAEPIRQALRWRQEPNSPGLRALAKKLTDDHAVVVHFRLNRAGPHTEPERSPLKKLGPRFYELSFRHFAKRLARPRWFCFADRPELLDSFMVLPKGATVVENALSAPDALWLMRHGRRFVLSNSTFAWWGAWLSGAPGADVLCPPAHDFWDNVDIYPADWRMVAV